MRSLISSVVGLCLAAGGSAVAGANVLFAQTRHEKAAGNTLRPDEARKLEARVAEQEPTKRTAGQRMFLAMFGGGGLLFVLIGIVTRLVAIAAQRNAARSTAPAKGRVFEYRTVVQTDSESGDSTRYDPVIDYQDAGGVTRRATVYGTSVMKFAVGQQVEVLYDPTCFERARIVGFDPDLYETLLFSVAFVGMGGIVFLIGLWVWVSKTPVAMEP